MAHELSIRTDGKAEMAFTGETPWHGLGQSVTKGASIGVWAKEAGMNWEAIPSVPQCFTGEGAALEAISFDSYKALHRSDTKAPIAIVGANYNVVQPLEVLEFFRDLTEQGGWHIHTAGVLRGGRKLWAMASNGDKGMVNPKAKRGHHQDSVVSNLLLATSLDGSMKTTALLTAVRVVCANTLALALQRNGEAITVSHRSVFDAQAVQKTLGLATESFEGFMHKAREMADTPIKMDESLEILRKIFGQPVQKAQSLAWMGDLASVNSEADAEQEEARESRVVSRVLELFDGAGMGATMPGVAGTRWGLFNAVTQHVDHEMGRTDDTRLDSAWFGRGNGFKQEALKLLVAA